jgi:ABC-type iron transport system FetAB permease component
VILRLRYTHKPFSSSLLETMAELPTDSTHLDWANVGLGFSFVLFNALVSTSLQLGVGSSLLSAAIRCVVQLALVALVLQKVFETNNPWAVAGIACQSDLY